MRKRQIKQNTTVLIVDDEPSVCELLKEALTGEGYTCSATPDAESALIKFEDETFDIALLDINLPGMSGVDFLTLITERYSNTVAIMLTAVNDVTTAVKAMKLGASDYIVKPFTVERVTASIVTALESLSREAKQHETSQPHSTIDAIAAGIDAHFDHLDSHSKLVTRHTVEAARQLGLPDEEIEKWAIEREKKHFARAERINSTLEKLKNSPLAQTILGLTRPVRPPKPKPN